MEGVYCNLMSNTVRDTLDLSDFDPTNYGVDEEATVPLDDIQTGIMFLFFLSGFSFTNIHELQDCRGKGRAFL